MPQGSRGYIGYKKEATWGTDPTGAFDGFFPFISETLTPKIPELLSAAQRGILDEPKSYQGEKQLSGELLLEVHPVSIGHILRSALGKPAGNAAADSVETELEDCEDAWNELVDSGVISGVDAADKKKGSYSVKLQVSVGVVGDDILATEEVVANMSADTHLKLWIKSSIACPAAGDLVIMVSEVESCGGAEGVTLKSRPIPILAANTWTEVTIALGYMSRSDIEFHDGGAGDDTITTVAGNFVTAGFAVDDVITVTGTDTSDGQYTLTGVTANTLTMDPASLPGNEVAGPAIINGMADYGDVISLGIMMHTDLAEVTVRIDDVRRVVAGTAGNAKKHVFTPMQTLAEEFDAGGQNTPLWPYTLEIFRDEGLPFSILGAVVNTLTLSFSNTDKIVKAACGILWKDYEPGNLEGPALEATKPFVWQNAKIGIGGTYAGAPNNNLESFSITWDNKLVPKYFLNFTAVPGKFVREGFREVTISFVIDFVDRTEYDLFLLGAEQRFQIILEGADCEVGYPYKLQLDLPLVRYLAFPLNIGGPGRMTCAVEAKAKYDAAGYVLQATLVNLQTTEYTAV